MNPNVIRTDLTPSTIRRIPESPPWEVRVGFSICDFSMHTAVDLPVLFEALPTGQADSHSAISRVHLVLLIDGFNHAHTLQFLSSSSRLIITHSDGRTQSKQTAIYFWESSSNPLMIYNPLPSVSWLSGAGDRAVYSGESLVMT